MWGEKERWKGEVKRRDEKARLKIGDAVYKKEVNDWMDEKRGEENNTWKCEKYNNNTKRQVLTGYITTNQIELFRFLSLFFSFWEKMEESKGKELERRAGKVRQIFQLCVYVWNGFETSVFKQCVRGHSHSTFHSTRSLDLLQFNLVESCQEIY